MGSRKDRKFRNYLINRDIQLRIISANLLYMAAVVLITMGVALSPLVMDIFFSTDLNVQYQSSQTFLALIQSLIPALLLMLVLIFLHQLMMTHRICGPLVNFNNSFQRISRGDLTRKVFLRQGDYLKDECNRINEMIDGLAALIARFRSNHARLIVELEDTLSRVEDIHTRNEINEVLGLIKNQAAAVHDDLAIFQLSGDLEDTLDRSLIGSSESPTG